MSEGIFDAAFGGSLPLAALGGADASPIEIAGGAVGIAMATSSLPPAVVLIACVVFIAAAGPSGAFEGSATGRGSSVVSSVNSIHVVTSRDSGTTLGATICLGSRTIANAIACA